MDVPVTPAVVMTDIPNEVRRWNWGAFFLTWIWGIGNNVLIAFLCFVPLLGFIMPIILGIKGGEWAWQKKRWDNLAHFQRVQRIWAWVGFGVFAWFMAMTAGLLIFLFTVFMKTEPYIQGLHLVTHAPAVIAELGEPVKPGWYVMGNVKIDSADGRAKISFPIYGPKGKGTAYVKAVKDMGKWHLVHVVVEIEATHERIEIMIMPSDEST